VPWTRVNPPAPLSMGYSATNGCDGWDTEGNIFISDGYINSRVASSQERRLGETVGRIAEPARRIQHAAQHRADAKGNIYVAESGNRRIQVFDPNGHSFAR